MAKAYQRPITSIVLKEKAIEINKELNSNDFGGSNGWLEHFKDRHCLSFKTVCGEAAAVDGNAVEGWKHSVLKDILSRCDASNIFNLDETGLFYNLLPYETLSFKGGNALLEKQANNALRFCLKQI